LTNRDRDTRPLPILTCPRPNRRAFPAIPTVSHTITVAPRERHLSAKQRWALEILAAAGLRGCAGATLLAHGFRVDMIAGLVHDGLATAHCETTSGQTQEPSQAVEVVRLFDYELRTVIIDESKPQPERGAATAGRRKHRPRRNWSSSTSSPGQQGWQPRVLPEADEAGAVGDCACPGRKARQRSVEIPAAFNASNGATAATSNGLSVSSTMPRFDRRP
jgi:hypothetical protein